MARSKSHDGLIAFEGVTDILAKAGYGYDISRVMEVNHELATMLIPRIAAQRASGVRKPNNLIRLRDTGYTRLHRAVEIGDKNRAQVLLAAGAPINAACDHWKYTPIMLACLLDRPAMVDILAEAGASLEAVDWRRNTVLSHAAAAGFEDLARRCIAAGADVNNVADSCMTPLLLAIEEGRVEMCRLLLESGAQANGARRQPRTSAAESAAAAPAPQEEQAGNIDAEADVDAGADDVHDGDAAVAADAEDDDGDNNLRVPLMLACTVGSANLQIAQLLIQGGAQVNAREGSETALDACAFSGNVQLAQLLVDSGFDMDAVIDGDRVIDSALISACAAGRVEMARFLLQHGANAAVHDAFDSPLIAVCRYSAAAVNGNAVAEAEARCLELIQLLVASGADVNLTVRGGHVDALLVAAKSGCDPVVQLLLQLGASVHGPSDAPLQFTPEVAFQFPLFVAAREAHVEVVVTLLSAGALDRSPNIWTRSEVEAATNFIRNLPFRPSLPIPGSINDVKTSVKLLILDAFRDSLVIG